MVNGTRVALWLVLSFSAAIAVSGSDPDPFLIIPSEQRQTISKRLDAYVDANKGRKWDKLYDLVSDTGRGGVSRSTFEAAMKASHGTDFANDPDLLEFKPARSEKNDDGYDLYGCAKARREGMMFDGIAVLHGVYEHDNWFFTGWTFDITDGPCSAFSDPRWQPTSRLKWKRPMEEITNFRQPGMPFHVDGPH